MSLSDLKPCLCGRPVVLFQFYAQPTEAGAHINIDCIGFTTDECPLNLSLTRDVASQQDVDDFLAAWNRRAEGVAALQQAGEQIAENANCYQQAGEPVAQWVMVPREPTSDMLAAADSAIPRFEEESDGSRLMGVDGALDAWKAMIAVSPLPQQTALVEEGVEKIIGPHEPAACGASAPSEAPRSDGWQDISSAPDEEEPWGGTFLAYAPHSMGGYCFVAGRNNDGLIVDTLEGTEHPFTHWMPLPPRPHNSDGGRGQ